MKAVLLAAGKGERLKDVTKSIPKPMLKVKGKPILEHNIEWLKSYGVTDIYVNLHHLSDAIAGYFGNGERFGVSIKYSFEPELLGTAGAVRKISDDNWRVNTEKGGFEPLFIIYGDNLMAYDLNDIMDFHKRKGGIATIAVYEKEDVSQSGIVLLDENGQIVRFIEKPRPEEIVSHLVNTGIYVLEADALNYIPADRNSDFGKEIFPSMLKNGEKIFAIEVEGNLVAVDTPELLNNALNQDMRRE